MDLRFFVPAFFSGAARITRCLTAASLCCAVAAQASPADAGRDYMLPADARGGFLEPVSSIQSAGASGKTTALSRYRAMDGQIYELSEFRGEYVSVLLPDTVPDGPSFTAEHVAELVDRLDELYALYREILGVEPAGTGPLTVAFVPDTCGTGCGLLGARGIEIRSEPLNYELIIAELDGGRLESILVHEMVHNFDRYAKYLHYLPDHPHAWTDFFQYFAAYHYGRNGHGDEAPDDLYASPLSVVWRSYVADERADWKNCVSQGGCTGRGLSANAVWAMPYYRMQELYGTGAVLRSFAWLTQYVKHHAPPATGQGKEDLRTLSLAQGAGVNLSCQMESLKWPVPADLADTLSRELGPPDPACDDADGDGFVPITGDCDETDPARNVLGEETDDNGFDDDCDGLTDEASLVESDWGARGEFGRVHQTGLPFEVSGSLADAQDSDVFEFPTAADDRARVTLCAGPGFRGWAVALGPDGNFLSEGSWFAYRSGSGCSSVTFDYDGYASGGVAVMADKASGEYSLTVAAAAPKPRDHSAYLEAVPRAAGGVSLQVSDRFGEMAALGADEIEVWIPEAGLLRSVPYRAETAITLDRATAPQLADGSLYAARMRPRAAGRPLLPFSAGHLFRYPAQAVGTPRVDHRYSGAWFDATHEGEGFIVEVLDGGRAVVYWFTYRADGRQRWMVGTGAVDGDRIRVDEMMESSGGRFGADFDPADVALKTVGSLSISFQSCEEALANYSIDEVGGSQSLTRLTHVYGHRCGAGEAPPAMDLSGSWYDPSHNGEGFVVEQVDGGQAVVFWFTYDAQGEQAWLFNTGNIHHDRIAFPELLQPVGGRFGRSFDSATVRLDPWGSLELKLGCHGGQASYESLADGFSSGTQSLVSLTRLQGSGCGGM